MLSDQDYLGKAGLLLIAVLVRWFTATYSADLTELGYFLGDLKGQVSHAKATDRVAFAQKYFELVSSGMHVVGMPYSYILESNLNRRAFSSRLLESFGRYNDGAEMHTIDFFYLVESLCPNFPRQLVLEVSQCLKRDPEGDGADTVHIVKYVLMGVICNTVYGEWLKLIADYYADESTVSSMNALKLKAKLEVFHASISPSVCQPPLTVIHSVIDAASASSNSTGASSFLVEITLDSFRRTLYVTDSVREELRRYCR
jgi:hypothetical protein